MRFCLKNFDILNLRNLFIGVFFLSLIISFFLGPIFLDGQMWADQALYFQTGNEIQYDFLQAYGHPGGPIIEGTIILKKIFSISYTDSLFYFLIIFNSLIITLICYIVYLLKKNLFFILTTFIVLSFHRFFSELTPTSHVSSLLFILQALYSLYLYENRQKLKLKDIIGFSVLSGLIMATRIDIGFIGTLFFGIYLLPRISMRDFIYTVPLMLGSFVLFDPYMWYMPFQHIIDLAYKFVYHYEFFYLHKLTIDEIFKISSLFLFSILLFIPLFCLYKNNFSFKKRFHLIIILLSIFLYYIFITSKINAIRYFAPIILLWEVFLPFIFLDLLKSNFFSSLFVLNNNKLALNTKIIFIIPAFFVLLISIDSLIIFSLFITFLLIILKRYLKTDFFTILSSILFMLILISYSEIIYFVKLYTQYHYNSLARLSMDAFFLSYSIIIFERISIIVKTNYIENKNFYIKLIFTFILLSANLTFLIKIL